MWLEESPTRFQARLCHGTDIEEFPLLHMHTWLPHMDPVSHVTAGEMPQTWVVHEHGGRGGGRRVWVDTTQAAHRLLLA